MLFVELRASRETAWVHDPSAATQFTPPELPIVRSVGHGLSSREIGAVYSSTRAPVETTCARCSINFP